MDEIEIRPLMPEDAGAAQALVAARLGGTRYETRAREQLEAALSFEDPEYMAVLAQAPAPRHLTGLAMFGTVAGAHRTTRLHTLLGANALVCEALVAAVRRMADDSGERLIVAEVADDEPFRDAILALATSGFVEEGRVADFVRGGVALRMCVWRAAIASSFA